jgi:hypothetical protein
MGTRAEWTGEAAQALGYGVGTFGFAQWLTDLSISDSALLAVVGAASGAVVGVARVTWRRRKAARKRL